MVKRVNFYNIPMIMINLLRIYWKIPIEPLNTFSYITTGIIIPRAAPEKAPTKLINKPNLGIITARIPVKITNNVLTM